ncbi:MAG: hypothetical protein AAB368_08845, partial [bacterium]
PTAGLTAITVTSGLAAGTTYYFYVAMKQALINGWQIAPSAGGAFQESGPPLADSLTLAATANEVAWVGFGDAADITVPSGITNLVAAPATSMDGAIALTWTAPGDDGAAGTATKYIIKYATWPAGGLSFTDSTTNWWNGGLINPTTPPAGARPVEAYQNTPVPPVAGVTQQITLSGLLAGATYHIAMRALDEAVNTSTLSNWVSAPASDLAPPAPTGVVIVAADRSLNVTWQAPLVAGAGPFGESLSPRDVQDYGFRIYYNPTRSGGGVVTGGQGIGAYDFLVDTTTMKTGISKTGLTRGIVVGGLQNGVPAYFVIATVDAKGNLGCAQELSGTPAAPANVRITEVMTFGPDDQPGGVGTAKDQFIELYNASDAPADITRWIVMNRSLSGTGNNNFVKAYIPPTTLGARQHYVIGFTQNTGKYRAGTRGGIVYPLADYESGDPETWDAVNAKQTGVWAAGQGPGKSSFAIGEGVTVSLLTPAAYAALDRSVSGSWKISAENMKNQPVVDRITCRTAYATAYVFFNVNSDGLPGGVYWPDGNTKYLDTEANSPPGVGPLFESRPSSWTVSFQRTNEDVDNDRLDDWTVGLANPGAGRDAALPAAIQDLRVSGTDTATNPLADGVDGGLLLTFTAPGDDAMAPGNYGRAFAYLVNYSTWYPTVGEEPSWLTASNVYVDAAPRTFTLGGVSYTAPSWEPLTPGSLERRRVGAAGLVAGVRYTFLVRGIDDVGNVF